MMPWRRPHGRPITLARRQWADPHSGLSDPTRSISAYRPKVFRKNRSGHYNITILTPNVPIHRFHASSP